MFILNNTEIIEATKVTLRMMEMNEVLEKLPQHLLSLVIEQPYNEYTSRDHAVWRYVMRQNVRFLCKVAHGSYVEGLRKTGISIDTIPHMYGMNRILKEIGWAAVAVDGFIPPSAFMEFQAYNVLVIAADIRPVDQIEYTPAPDIIHEAAGHAPIIADTEYAEYLRFFGQIGSKAFASVRDNDLYEAVRHLSILKSDPYSTDEEIANAEINLAAIDASMGEPSEMSLIRNLHWWTVEYGLIGDLKAPRIYGAGLLSSIGESYNCLLPHIKKIPYSIQAANYNFDITTQQPQLFVTPDFNHLSDVLNQFANGMALRTGGKEAVVKAQNSGNTATIMLDSGVQISGTFHNCILNEDEVVYLRTNSPTALAFNNEELPGHGKAFHRDGYGTPIGNLVNSSNPLHLLSVAELAELGIEEGKDTFIEYSNGVQVKGHLISIRKAQGKNLVFTFHNCTVSYHGEILFNPSWGRYDMALGQKVISAFPGPADPQAFQLSYRAPSEATHKIKHSAWDLEIFRLYQKVRERRDLEPIQGSTAGSTLIELWEEVKNNFPKEWLLMIELLEHFKNKTNNRVVADEIFHMLNQLKESNKTLNKLISDGLQALNSSSTVKETIKKR